MKDIPALTGLRGVAALAVAAFHAIVLYTLLGPGYPGGAVPFWLCFGWVGVDLFFVLTGFLLAVPFLERPERVRSGRYWGTYYVKRWLRIGPPLYAAVIAVLLLARTPEYFLHEWDVVVSHVFFTYNLDVDSVGAISGPFWSIATEAHYYLILPLFVALFSRRFWPWALAASILASLLWRQWVFIPGQEYKTVWIASLLPGFLAHFALGVTAARLHVDGWRPRLRPTQAVLLASLGFLLSSLIFHVPRGEVPGFHPFFEADRSISHVWYRLFLALLFAFVILALTWEPSGVGRFLSWRPSQFLGRISYSLYLVHLPVGLFALDAWPATLEQGWVPYVAFNLTLVILAGWIFYLLVEAPSLRIKDAWARRRARPHPRPGPVPAASGKPTAMESEAP